MFVGQEVTVQERTLEDANEDVVYLLDEGDVVAKSPLGAVQDSILVVNSDLYKTGTRKPEDVELPAVIDGLANTPFRLRGHPTSDKEKLLLITVSRYIERLALETDGGTHRASFQRLSRINDEQGTRAVYERLADTDTETHVYGMPDWTPPPEFDVTMHGGWNEDFRTSWFVVHVPADSSRPHAALVAIEVESGTWDGLWTYDTDTVQQLNRYIEREL
ncbi:hypothetical protein GCM10009019_21650 [Salarchaeum japonicum]|uniref:DICT domain-containing protein n=2 Tax=Salarchaeum japonicum TaxID=555573 RepID=A0AAV3T3V7_9EURY